MSALSDLQMLRRAFVRHVAYARHLVQVTPLSRSLGRSCCRPHVPDAETEAGMRPPLCLHQRHTASCLSACVGLVGDETAPDAQTPPMLEFPLLSSWSFCFCGFNEETKAWGTYRSHQLSPASAWGWNL